MNLKTADRLVELRKTYGYSQEALSEKLGVSRQAISKWERGESSPDTDNLIALAEVYGISLDELLNTEKEIIKPKDKEKEKRPSIYPKLAKKLFKFPFWLLISGVYVGYNLVFHQWHPSWLIFLLIPIYYHFAGVCYCKSKKAFLLSLPIPEITILLYLILGFSFDVWAKGLFVLIIIPIYYWVIAFYKKK